jgi:hypothetical protein
MKGFMVVPVGIFAWALVACTTSKTETASGTVATIAPADPNPLRQDMRRLWSDHVVWTRGYIVAAVAGDPSAPVALARLMKNQEDIGNAMKPYYGDSAGTKLTALLKEHIAIAGELVGAAKAGETAKQADADKRWHDNAAEIATFLSGANPNWTREGLLMMLNSHLSLTTNEAVARLTKNWADDQATFDKIYTQAMEMADGLSDGILKQFPAK